MTGTVKTKTEKGFGFIAVEGQAKKFSTRLPSWAFLDELREGDTVSFETEESLTVVLALST